MATNFPGAFDAIGGTLGGAFVNASPVVNPATNIDAVLRNNLNDAMIAVQTKLGTTGSLFPTSVDWGLLGAGGTPNRGLQFATSGNVWPSLDANAGIFQHLATGMPAFHLGGDPAATFYDVLLTNNPAVPVNVALGFTGATNQLTVGHTTYAGTGVPAADGAVFFSAAFAAPALCTMQVRANATSGGLHYDTTRAIQVVTDSGSAMTAGEFQYGVVSSNICQDIAVGTALGFDFLAQTPVKVGAGAGNFATYGYVSDIDHTVGFYSVGANSNGFFSKNDYRGFSAENATDAAFFADAGCGYGLYLGAATTLDIYSAQTKVTFAFASDAATEVFSLDASGLDAAGGRTGTPDSMLYLHCPIGNNGTAQRIDLWNCKTGDGAGGNSIYTVVRSGDGDPYKALINTGVMTAFYADHITDAADNVAGIHQAINANFSFAGAAGGVANTGPIAYGLHINMPESYVPAGTYHTNDGVYGTARWAIKVDAGETSLRRTLIEGPDNLGKAVLYIKQANPLVPVATAEGMFKLDCPAQSHAVAAKINVATTPAGDGAGGFAHYSYLSSLDDELAAAGELTGYYAEHKTKVAAVFDDAASIHQSFVTSFTLPSTGGGTANAGPAAYGLRVTMPESAVPAGTYHTNDGTYGTARWAIKVEAGETNLRRTFMEGPSNLGKAVLHIHQVDEPQAFIKYDGSSSGVDNSLNMTTAAVQGVGAVVGPQAVKWAFAGMVKIAIVDDNNPGGITNGDYWMPIYSYV